MHNNRQKKNPRHYIEAVCLGEEEDVEDGRSGGEGEGEEEENSQLYYR